MTSWCGWISVNLALFFEGTGQGVAGKVTNVTRLHDLCREDEGQRRHLESGPGTHVGAILAGAIHGADWQIVFRGARRWFEANYETLPPPTHDGRRASLETKVFLFGFSRGALIARHFAAWLDKLSIPVAYLGIWDTVDSTLGLDVPEVCPANVRVARHAVARDEMRRFFQVIPLHSGGPDTKVLEMVFPGVHSDVGGLYADNHVIADVALAWMAAGAVRAGLRLDRGVHLTQRFDWAAASLHSSHSHISNLFGAFAPVRRALAAMRAHPSCRQI